MVRFSALLALWIAATTPVLGQAASRQTAPPPAAPLVTARIAAVPGGVAIAEHRRLWLFGDLDGRVKIRSLAFPDDIVSMVWCEPLRAVLVASGPTLSAVPPGGPRAVISRAHSAISEIAVDPLAPCFALLVPDSEPSVVFYHVAGTRAVETGGALRPSRHPWRISFGDVDGDGESELFVGVTGRARFHKTDTRRPFVYSRTASGLAPKWLGSRLARPFVDALLADLDGDRVAELVAIEVTREGRRELAVYGWKSFGFVRTAVSDDLPEDLRFSSMQGERILTVAGGTLLRMRLSGERIEHTAAVPGNYIAGMDTQTGLIAVSERAAEIYRPSGSTSRLAIFHRQK